MLYWNLFIIIDLHFQRLIVYSYQIYTNSYTETRLPNTEQVTSAEYIPSKQVLVISFSLHHTRINMLYNSLVDCPQIIHFIYITILLIIIDNNIYSRLIIQCNTHDFISCRILSMLNIDI